MPTVDLSGAHTKSGMNSGDNASFVVGPRLLGKPMIINACGMQRYEYNDTNVKGAESNDSTSRSKNGQVIEIMPQVDG